MLKRKGIRERGLALIETAMVLGIAAVVMAGVMCVVQNLSMSHAIGDYSGQIVAMVDAGKDSSRDNAFHGHSSAKVSGDQVEVSTTNVPREACFRLGLGERVGTDGNTLAPSKIVVNGWSLPLEIDHGRLAAAEGACVGARNGVVWSFPRR
jgi:hypothetical protein